ncbi:hypothetical protein ABWL39_16410 [Chitinivorax sp. PXF-14]|uniref:hypothetical protein n=1 Tax=Chitinivorax sp. PXF-14 TaxID=3230488 RepID=UPI0034656604
MRRTSFAEHPTDSADTAEPDATSQGLERRQLRLAVRPAESERIDSWQQVLLGHLPGSSAEPAWVRGLPKKPTRH